VNYEAQAAIELEMCMDKEAEGSYPLGLVEQNGGWQIDTRPLFEAIVQDLRRATPASVISMRFHRGLVEVFAGVATAIRERTKLNRVVLSGGTFQNGYLLEQLPRRLTQAGFEVFTPAQVPAGDGGLSLGQAIVATQQFT